MLIAIITIALAAVALGILAWLIFSSPPPLTPHETRQLEMSRSLAIVGTSVILAFCAAWWGR